MSQLWAITSFFNPSGYNRRLENYRIFRAHLNIPLIAVELSFDGRFALADSDADIVIRTYGTDVMWQKERLLNIAAARLPDNCRNLAWLDCDVVFESDQWAGKTNKLLEEFQLIQLFDKRLDLSKDTPSSDLYRADLLSHITQTRPSSAIRYTQGISMDLDFERPKSRLHAKATTGLAWAMTVDSYRKHGFYDACIVGGGDRSMFAAAIDRADLGIVAQRMTGTRKSHYLAWAEGFQKTIQGKVGYVPGSLYHLWHGEFQDRHYVSRYGLLSQYDFDPTRDIRLANDGT